MIPSVDVFHIVQWLGFNKPLFVGIDPDVPNSPYVVVRDVGGSSNPRFLRDEFDIQFWAKAAREDYTTAYNTLLEIKNLLLGITTVKVWDVETDEGVGIQVEDQVFINFLPSDANVIEQTNERQYIRFLVVSDVSMVGQDENNRYFFSLNFTITREERTAVGNRIPIE